ncbi:glycosyltransferase [Haloactinomyces albus]|uniref:Hopene-associated glycosyltransferase HpnB n=1 Tax=Haloactinomyces albus TaxID=1352928 RepID=A0AAE4CNQ9_9ACTN|nr:glycosyltransferase [Haloactinomyces albus]MDR7303716.1 hopene-associated glycosyltransferase HpnB [Haloactinomyces albus]
MAVVGWIAVGAWLVLGLLRGRFWCTDQRLPPLAAVQRWPSVAIVVPARNEAGVVTATLPTLLSQRYPGRVRVVLVDDNSTDGTAHVSRRIGGTSLTVTTPATPPEGWSGKLWAVDHGIAEAGEVDYILLTDADIAHGPDSLTALVQAAEGGHDLVSQMAMLRTETLWERLVVPAFVYFFALLYPFRRVNRPTAATAAAAGGCMLVRREVLARAGGVAAIRGAVIDDVALARLVQSCGGRLWLGLAGSVRSLRACPRLADLWHMIARSAYPQLRYSPVLLAGTVLGLGVVFLAPPVTTVAGTLVGDLAVLVPGAVAWLVMAATFAPMLRYYGRPLPAALLLPATALLYMLMTLDSARRHWSGRGTVWKGRSYSIR